LDMTFEINHEKRPSADELLTSLFLRQIAWYDEFKMILFVFLECYCFQKSALKEAPCPLLYPTVWATCCSVFPTQCPPVGYDPSHERLFLIWPTYDSCYCCYMLYMFRFCHGHSRNHFTILKKYTGILISMSGYPRYLVDMYSTYNLPGSFARGQNRRV
jgi:hypothetical protein